MSSLILPFAIQLTLAVGLLWLTRRLDLARLSKGRGTLLLGGALAVFLISLGADGRPALLTVLPVVDLYIWIRGSMLLAAAALVGLASRLAKGPRWRREGISAVLLLLVLYHCYGHLLQSTASSVARWRGGVCIQSHPSSCSAAAAATVLHSRGIESSEAEMMELCLTRRGGTPFFGIYRGLRLKTEGSPWTVVPTEKGLDEVLAGPLPALLIVSLPRGAEVDPRYQSEWGWTPGVQHAVVLLALAEGSRVLIGDPMIGPEHWYRKDLQVLWQGRALRLEPR